MLTGAIAAAGFGLRYAPGLSIFSPMILAITVGIGMQNIVGTPVAAKAGVTFALRRVLRFAIILLGLQLTVQQAMAVGVMGLGAIVLTLVCTFMFTTWFGRVLGVDRRLTQLIAAGTSICGASAVIATNTVTGAKDEDVAYAVACVTIFGSMAMFIYPLLPGLLHLNAHAYGLWTGASIHEIAQVVAAAFQGGQDAGEFGTVSKLTRVAMLAPVVIVLGLIAARRARGNATAPNQASAPIPWFVFGFLAMIVVNSLITIPADVKATIVIATTFLLSMALAAMGLETDLAKLRAKGIRPFLLGFAAFLFIASFSLALVKMIA
ncbi:YeiH family protein [Roseiarcaceae bacterium H3SJ34-1]|uniref:YeiH family protein n=1 Tax=Terripilifer ovatus TaxID=3032367 RepID=UPI003AB973F5|nr:YeiH family protein [Roseiarcaceae bacterium H3SJ34-1]